MDDKDQELPVADEAATKAAIKAERLAQERNRVLSASLGGQTDTVLKRVGLVLKGHVTYTAGDDWIVLGAQSKTPVAAFGYQIPDPADEGTPHSTNVSVSLYDLDTSKGREAFKTIGKKYGVGEPKASRVGEWKVLEQSPNQGGTRYVILDAYKAVADVTVAVRLAWPQLATHSRDYDRKLRKIFERLLSSFRGELGLYKRRDGDVLRRPR
jgi:hypothetical protein